MLLVPMRHAMPFSALKNILFDIDRAVFKCLVAWPLNESEAGVELVLIETSLLF